MRPSRQYKAEPLPLAAPYAGRAFRKKRVGKKQMNHSIKKAWNIISSILVALVVILALLLVGVRLVGLQAFTALSGSIEPTYHTGSLIYVKKVDPFSITKGQPITFMLDENTVATHRVVGIVPDEEDPSVIRFRTKGDANDAEDGRLVHYRNVIGTPVFTIPYAACADSGIGSAEGVLAVSGQAHGTDGHTDLLHDADQLQTLLPRPIQTGQPRIGLVNADLHKVVAAFPGTFEHFAPAQGTGHGLFV